MAGQTITIDGNFDDALKIVRKISEDSDGIELVNSLNPYVLNVKNSII